MVRLVTEVGNGFTDENIYRELKRGAGVCYDTAISIV